MKILEGKVVVLGSQGVGKTSMIVRYIGQTFQENVNPTVGASFFTCKLNIENARVMLQVWDTAGQERFRSMAPMYYRNANAAMLVFDLTQYNTFIAMKGWVTELRRNIEDAMVLVIIGNKSDLWQNRQVSADEGRVYATEIGATYHETSVLQGNEIENVFLDIATGVLKLYSTEYNSTSARIHELANTNRNGADVTRVLPFEENETIDIAYKKHRRLHACC